MDEHMIRDLLRTVKDLEGKPDVRRGVVSAVAPLAVKLGNAGTPYTSVQTVGDQPLAVGDVVMVLFYGGNMIVLGAISTPSVWHTVGAVGEPAFTNGWVNFGGSEQVAQYARIGSRGYTRGLVKNGTINLPAFTLPLWCRPPATVRFGGVSNSAFAYLAADVLGAVTVAAGSSTWADLSPINFDVRA